MLNVILPSKSTDVIELMDWKLDEESRKFVSEHKHYYKYSLLKPSVPITQFDLEDYKKVVRERLSSKTLWHDFDRVECVSFPWHDNKASYNIYNIDEVPDELSKFVAQIVYYVQSRMVMERLKNHERNNS